VFAFLDSLWILGCRRTLAGHSPKRPLGLTGVIARSQPAEDALRRREPFPRLLRLSFANVKHPVLAQYLAPLRRGREG
jgi:hypothetical protein